MLYNVVIALFVIFYIYFLEYYTIFNFYLIFEVINESRRGNYGFIAAKIL